MLTSRTELFEKARAAFLYADQSKTDQLPFCGVVKIFRALSKDKKDIVIFGVKREDQASIDFPTLRSALAKEMGYSEPKRYIQFIGDSALYSVEGTKFAQQEVNRILSNDQNSIVLYGYTGSKNKEGQERRDINQLLSDWVDADEARADRVIANIVDKHTVMAINQWGCIGSEKIRYFFLVYSDGKEPSVEFGQDIPSSDGLTDLKAYSLEGGIQSLRQIVYMLNKDIPIHGIANLRNLTELNNPRFFDPTSKLPYLSAVEFIEFMKKKIQLCKSEISPELLAEFSRDYLDSHALYNKNKGDASTKCALWDAAWKDFINAAWKKLSLFTYSDNREIITEDVNVAALIAHSILETKTKPANVLSYLSLAYDTYYQSGWNSKSLTPYGGHPGKIVKDCLNNPKYLEKISARIGEGLIHHEEGADKCLLLFERLFYEGFKDGLHKEQFQNNFRHFYTEEMIKSLIDRTLSMADMMKSFYDVKSVKSLAAPRK